MKGWMDRRHVARQESERPYTAYNRNRSDGSVKEKDVILRGKTMTRCPICNWAIYGRGSRDGVSFWRVQDHVRLHVLGGPER